VKYCRDVPTFIIQVTRSLTYRLYKIYSIHWTKQLSYNSSYTYVQNLCFIILNLAIYGFRVQYDCKLLLIFM